LPGEVRVKIDLTKIEDEPVEFAEELILDPESLDETRVAGPMVVRLEGTVRSMADHFLLNGRGTAEGKLGCVRCLEPVSWRVSSTYAVEIALAESAPLEEELALDEGDLDVHFLEEPVLDLEHLAIEQIVLELPMRVLCNDDCAGLCPQCGENRNVEGACRCEPEPDPRWAALADLAGRTPGN
jgi:uncharacterized protein